MVTRRRTSPPLRTCPRITASMQRTRIGTRDCYSLIAVCAGLLAAAPTLGAQTATQVVTFSVIRAPSTAMTFATSSLAAPARRAVVEATRASVNGSTYTINTTEANQKITASLHAPLPRDVSLSLSLAPPTGAWSSGPTTLLDAATDVVGRISQVSADALSMEYTITARTDAPRRTMKPVVAFTITGGA